MIRKLIKHVNEIFVSSIAGSFRQSQASLVDYRIDIRTLGDLRSTINDISVTSMTFYRASRSN